MSLSLTLALAALALAFTVMCGLLGARASARLGSPRLVPWRFLMLLGFLAVLALAAHLVTLARSG